MSTQSNPYADTADAYWRAGWRGIIPLAYGQKTPPPAGTTGHNGEDPSYADVIAWTEHPEPQNIGLRLPSNVIGIDVDHYGDKAGGETLARWENDWGPLPATWRSTSRDDGTSGIRLYTVPPGRTWPSIMGAGIDILQRTHRYAVVAPSLHPNGGRYTWIRPDGLATDHLPTINDIPPLPAEWVDGLTTQQTTSIDAPYQRGIQLDGRERAEIMARLPGGEPCRHVLNAAGKAMSGGARHDSYNAAVLAVLAAGRRGCPGSLTALQRLHTSWVAELAPDRGQTEAKHEWARSLAGALNLIATEPQGAVCTDAALDAWLNTTNPTASSGDNDGDTDGDGQAAQPIIPADDPYTRAVQSKALDLQINHDARQLLQQRQAAQLPAIECIPLDEFLEQDDDPVRYLIDQLWPHQGRVILSAAAKSGKSTLILNLLRSLADAQPFLNTWDTNPPDGHIAYLNMEIGGNQLRHWMRRININNADAIVVANLRGKSHALGLGTDQGRDRFATWLDEHWIRTVILDPLAPVLASLGIDENDNAGVAQFFDWWNRTLVDAGVHHDFIAHHTGRATNTRSRGASRLDDEPDAIWTLRRYTHGDEDDYTIDPDPRTLKAYGRDVELPETMLAYDPTTGQLHTTDEKPHTVLGKHNNDRDRNAIITAVQTLDKPISMTALSRLAKGEEKRLRPLIKAMIEEGRLASEPGPGGGTLVLPL